MANTGPGYRVKATFPGMQSVLSALAAQSITDALHRLGSPLLSVLAISRHVGVMTRFHTVLRAACYLLRLAIIQGKQLSWEGKGKTDYRPPWAVHLSLRLCF